MRPEGFGNTDLSTTELFRDKPYTFDSPFAYCEAACRTTSSSTLHENAFIGERKYCYRFNRGHLKRPKAGITATASRPGSSTGTMRIVAGAEGQSCTEACEALQPPMACAHDANNTDEGNTASSTDEGNTASPFRPSCDMMREYFLCEAGCFTRQDGVTPRDIVEETYPSYVAPWGPKPDWPAACFSDESAVGACQAKVAHATRLCACEETMYK
jgi:hypothetical protein